MTVETALPLFSAGPTSALPSLKPPSTTALYRQLSQFSLASPQRSRSVSGHRHVVKRPSQPSMPVSRFSDSESDAEGTDRSEQLSSESGEVEEADGRKARGLAGVQGQTDDDWIRLLGQQSHTTSVPSTWLKTCNSAPPTLTQASALSTSSERFSECGSYFDLDTSSSRAASVTSRSDTTTVPNDSPGYFNISSPYDSDDDEGCQTKPKGEASSDQRGLLLQPPRPPRRRPISGSPLQATIVKRPQLISHASYPAPANGSRPPRRPKLLSHATFPRPTKSAEPDVFGGHCGEARPNISKLAQQSSLHASWKLQDSSFLQGDSTDDEDDQMDGNATARRLRRTRNASSASSRRKRELSGLGLGPLQCDEENRRSHWSTESRGLASPIIPQRPFPSTCTQGHRALTPPRRPVLTRRRSITVKVDDSTGGLLPPLRYSMSTNINNNAKGRGISSSSGGGPGGEHDDSTFVKTPTLANGTSESGSGSCEDARAVSTGEQHVYAYWV